MSGEDLQRRMHTKELHMVSRIGSAIRGFGVSRAVREFFRAPCTAFSRRRQPLFFSCACWDGMLMRASTGFFFYCLLILYPHGNLFCTYLLRQLGISSARSSAFGMTTNNDLYVASSQKGAFLRSFCTAAGVLKPGAKNTQREFERSVEDSSPVSGISEKWDNMPRNRTIADDEHLPSPACIDCE